MAVGCYTNNRMLQQIICKHYIEIRNLNLETLVTIRQGVFNVTDLFMPTENGRVSPSGSSGSADGLMQTVILYCVNNKRLEFHTAIPC